MEKIQHSRRGEYSCVHYRCVKWMFRLSASSSKFKAMLHKSGKQEPFIEVSYFEMQTLVNCMYLGQTEIAQEDLDHFLQIEAKFDVKGLTEHYSADDSDEEME